MRSMEITDSTQQSVSTIDLLRANLGEDITLKALKVIYRRYNILKSGELKCRKCQTILDLENCSFERWAVRRESICRSCESKKAKLKGEKKYPPAKYGEPCACRRCDKVKNSVNQFDTDVVYNPSTGKPTVQYLCASCNRSKQDDDYCKIHGFYLGPR